VSSSASRLRRGGRADWLRTSGARGPWSRRRGSGRLQQFDSPTELYDHPANVFVAGFIGSPAMNRFDGTVSGGAIRVGGTTLHPPEGQLRAAQGHGKLTVGIRPEHRSVGGTGELTLEVALVEDLGSDSYVYGHLAGDAASHVIVRASRDHPRPGEIVKVKADTSRPPSAAWPAAAG